MRFLRCITIIIYYVPGIKYVQQEFLYTNIIIKLYYRNHFLAFNFSHSKLYIKFKLGETIIIILKINVVNFYDGNQLLRKIVSIFFKTVSCRYINMRFLINENVHFVTLSLVLNKLNARSLYTILIFKTRKS